MLIVSCGVLANRGVVVVCELSGESRFRSMVKESSMELKPAALSKGGGFYGSLRCWRLKVWGRCFSQKSAEVEALSSGGSLAIELVCVYVMYYNKMHGRLNCATVAFVRRKGRQSGLAPEIHIHEAVQRTAIQGCWNTRALASTTSVNITTIQTLQ